MWQVIINTYIDGKKTGAAIYCKTYKTERGARKRAISLNIADYRMYDGREFKQLCSIREV